ncbi:sugar transferase [Holdemanella porci]|uniref:sugar transferase n=1 Tax=Holdemanella porci TaxID=2652276 RepID=UPI0022DFE8F7|nr:sugar transferase [Holdemanella porci]
MLFLTIGIYFILTYIVRELWKRNIKKGVNSGKRRKLLIVTSSTIADRVIDNVEKNNYSRFDLVGVALLDKDLIGNQINNVSVVANNETAGMYACKEWVDEVLIVLPKEITYPNTLIEQLTLAGITVHMNLAKVVNSPGKKQFVEKIGDYTVLTTSINYVSLNELFLKRVFDIICGLLGCIFTLIICIFIGPVIYIASPGPIFFSQERVGKNGKKFKMYKFRSMYLDAEERKAELMKDNKLGDGKMFKLDFDPRVIGNKVMSDGSHKTGIGEFICKTSLDEFPQFFNVLKGDMSIVGTRPPLISETNLYEYQHFARLAIKPGITGMWQVSGRSEIIDFDEVVKLDKYYIENWNLGLDIKILLKTVLVVVCKKGAV